LYHTLGHQTRDPENLEAGISTKAMRRPIEKPRFALERHRGPKARIDRLQQISG
jgi:hypothetical protein